MRLIDYYNYAALAVLAGIILLILPAISFRRRSLPDADNCQAGSRHEFVFYILAGCLFIAAGFFMRLWRQAGVPIGMHQDEANIGYEAYILAAYGVDRDLHPWPVYPITYGSGGGSPLLIYLNVLTTKWFGSNIVVLRRTCAFFGCLTVPLAAWIMTYFVKDPDRTPAVSVSETTIQNSAAGQGRAKSSKNIRSARLFCLGAMVFSILPWHVILSRWSLDSNTTPFWEMLAVLLLILAIRRRSTILYMSCSAICALCLYSYGSANVVIPLFLLLILPLCMLCRRLSLKQLILSGVVFIIVLCPLIAFYAVNYLGLPEILTPYFSVNRFTSNRLGNVFIFSSDNFPHLLRNNLRVLLQNLTFGFEDDSFENFIPSFTQLYKFTFPVTWLGFFVCAVRCVRGLRNCFSAVSSNHVDPIATAGSHDDSVAIKETSSFPVEAVLLALFFSAALFSLFVFPRINRFVLMYAPMACFLVLGLEFIAEKSRKLEAAACCLLLVGGLLFARDYFYRYDTLDAEWLGFMPGYSEAVVYAESLVQEGKYSGSIYHTRENVNTLYLIALYALKTSPYDYQETVVYLPEWDEFRHTKEFGNLKYYLPEDVENGTYDPADYLEDIFIVNNYEEWKFDPELYDYTVFDHYAVITHVKP